jgi:hypothetical protein
MTRNSWVGIFLMVVSTHCLAQSDFRFRRDISDISHEGWYALSLPSDMFKDLNRDFGDLRLYTIQDQDTIEVPYLLDIRVDETRRQAVDLRLFNRGRRDGMLFLTFELRPDQRVNSIHLDFEEDNYFGRVAIEGSADLKEWFEIAKDLRIVSIKNAATDYDLSTVAFPLSQYKFLRVSVKADTPLTFRKASFEYNEVRPGLYRDLPLHWKFKRDKETNLSFVDITFNDYMPVTSISIRANQATDHYRAFRLDYVRDSSRTDKGWIKSYETIYEGDLTSYSPNEFSFGQILAREMRLVINDRDNQPLTIGVVAASGPLVKVISFLKPGKNFMLYGSGGAQRPSYDLTYFENKIPDNPPTAMLGSAVTINAERASGGALFESRVWLWALMVAMIAGLGFYTIRMMKSSS